MNNNTSDLKIVLAFGTFDYLHAGHEFYLKKAREMGNNLIVIISRDKTVTAIKGKNPDHSERQRLKKIKSLNIADKVVLGFHDDKHKVLKKFKPNVIALGYDQFVFTQKLKKTLIDLKLDAQIIRIDAHFPQVYKSSIIREQKINPIQINNPAHQI
ncbi:adenylyltransferase/cytidyltransferase family protein [Candidatus Peregrinibacteria bacterium]|nr:adenylyltransferase/cytidyltransferase family protein [Candidatus Peregrinibacteria bacterium]